MLIRFLKRFYDATNLESGWRYVITSSYFSKVFKIKDILATWFKSKDCSLPVVTIKIKENFDKYWRNVDKINMMLLIAIFLDSRYKSRYVRLCYADIESLER